MTTEYDPMTGIALESSVPGTSMAHDDAKVDFSMCHTDLQTTRSEGLSMHAT